MNRERITFDEIDVLIRDGGLSALNNFATGVQDRLRPPRELSWIQFENEDEFLAITVQLIGKGNAFIVPPNQSQSLRAVAERIVANSYSFERLASQPPISEGLHDPDWFRPCLPAARNFDMGLFSPIVVTDLMPKFISLDPESRFSLNHGDGTHRSLVLAVKLLLGEEVFHPVEAIYFVPREIES